MTISICRKPTDKRKKYLVGAQKNLHVYADTLAEAKKAGEWLAKKEVWRGSWNVAFLTIPILVADASDSIRYVSTGWRMYVPVRGTGATSRQIIARIRQRHNVAPMVWTKE